MEVSIPVFVGIILLLCVAAVIRTRLDRGGERRRSELFEERKRLRDEKDD
jgi:hypothetical protein